MNKKLLTTILTILGLTVIVGSFWYFSKLQKTNTNLTQNNNTKNIASNQNQEKTPKQKNTNQNKTIDGELKPKEKIDTSDWKTYRNEELGFEVKYPKEWKVEIKGKNQVFFCQYKKGYFMDCKDYFGISKIDHFLTNGEKNLDLFRSLLTQVRKSLLSVFLKLIITKSLKL